MAGLALTGLPSPVLVIASGNPHKVAEIAAMLDAVDLEVRRQPDALEIEETGSTYLANARLKAEAVASLTGQWALADDSGLAVDALGGAPGVYSARYAPTDHERIHRLLQELGPTPYRSASFNSAMARPIPRAPRCSKPRASAAVKSSGPSWGQAAAMTRFFGFGKRP